MSDLRVYEITEEEFEQQLVPLTYVPDSIVVVQCIDGQRQVWKMEFGGLCLVLPKQETN